MSYEIRQMSVGEILDMAFRLLRDNFVLVVGLSACLNLPLPFVNAYLLVGGTPESTMFAMGASLLVLMVLSPVVSVAITYALAEKYLGRESTLREALSVALALFMPILGTSFLYVLFLWLGFMALFIPGLVLAIRYLLISQVMIIERKFGLAALRRSSELMRTVSWRGMGLFIVIILVVLVLGTVPNLTLSWIPIVGPLVEGIGSSIAGAFSSAVMVVFYFDLRCRKEDFDLEHLAALVQSRTSR